MIVVTAASPVGRLCRQAQRVRDEVGRETGGLVVQISNGSNSRGSNSREFVVAAQPCRRIRLPGYVPLPRNILVAPAASALLFPSLSDIHRHG